MTHTALIWRESWAHQSCVVWTSIESMVYIMCDVSLAGEHAQYTQAHLCGRLLSL